MAKESNSNARNRPTIQHFNALHILTQHTSSRVDYFSEHMGLNSNTFGFVESKILCNLPLSYFDKLCACNTALYAFSLEQLLP